MVSGPLPPITSNEKVATEELPLPEWQKKEPLETGEA